MEVHGALLVELSQVPDYLRGGITYMYRNPSVNTFEVPFDAFKNDSSVTCPDSARHLLKTLSYWRVRAIPSDLISYIQGLSSAEHCMAHLASFNHNLEYMPVLWEVRSAADLAKMDIAIRHGYLEIIIYLDQMGFRIPDDALSIAESYGHVNCLPFLETRPYLRLKRKYPKAEDLCLATALAGDVEMLQYACESGCAWNDSICEKAAYLGHLNVLQYAYEHGYAWGVATCREAARCAELECLTFAHERGCPWDSSICSIAAYFGHLKCLRYAHEHGCPWDEDTTMAAARMGRIECLSYALDSGCVCDNDAIVLLALEKKDLQLLMCAELQSPSCDAARATICADAAQRGDLDQLKYARQHGFPWNATVYVKAFAEGHCHIARYAHDNGCPWSDKAIKAVWSCYVKRVHKADNCCNGLVNGVMSPKSALYAEIQQSIQQNSIRP